MTDSLCAFTPVLPGQAEALDRYLRDLPAGEQSVLAGLPGSHMGRFVVVPHLRGKNLKPAGDTAYLLFGAEFDGPREGYVAAFAATEEAHAIYAHCAGFRDDGSAESLSRYLRDYLVEPGYSTVAYPDVELADVLYSLKLRDRLSNFALRAQGLDGQALKQAWIDQFGESE